MEEITIASNLASESVDFSLFSLFLRADLVVKSVIIILILSSIYSWNIIISKLIRMQRLNKHISLGQLSGFGKNHYGTKQIDNSRQILKWLNN